MAKVLVVDDNDGILDAMQALLEFNGHEVEVCLDGYDALDMLKRGYIPDVILLDVLLSGADGRDICRQIKKYPATKDVPVIMVSAHPTAGKTVKSSGASDFLAKPFNMNVLLEKVDKQISG